VRTLYIRLNKTNLLRRRTSGLDGETSHPAELGPFAAHIVPGFSEQNVRQRRVAIRPLHRRAEVGGRQLMVFNSHKEIAEFDAKRQIKYVLTFQISYLWKLN
jgi:hypothetical protein